MENGYASISEIVNPVIIFLILMCPSLKGCNDGYNFTNINLSLIYDLC